MQKSLYQDKTFADYWNERAGDEGEVYKRYVLDPIMFSLIGNLKDKTVLELGCGNGHLGTRFVAQNPKHVIMLDISKYNLMHAAGKCRDARVKFVEQDATQPWGIEATSVDVVYSNMMLNEVEASQAVIREVFKALKNGGEFIFSVTHPAWDLYVYAQEKAGVPSKKIFGLGGYFRRGYAKFIMGSDNNVKPEIKGNYKDVFEVEHYQRPVEDYFNQLVDAGFKVKKLLEPKPSDELLRLAPRFADNSDHPIGLIFYCVK
jgi:ubiquinone/menaquinone biosynthesis C-methylase UbiE